MRNVEATFPSEQQAREAAEAARRAGLQVTVDADQDRRDALRSEMRDEVESLVAGAGNVGPFTKSMTKGLVVAVPVGLVVGALLGLLVGLIPFFGLESSTRMWIGLGIGAAAGATTGFVVGGFLKSRFDREGDVLESERGVTVGIHTNREDEVRKARRLLERNGARRVGVTDQRGDPVGPTSEEQARPVRGR
ncbi:MAG TPA: hypothetical protein VG602_07535 [Actinomycetota bacterium]|nr:hypothetical protein [Actinomycetota bacterium]